MNEFRGIHTLDRDHTLLRRPTPEHNDSSSLAVSMLRDLTKSQIRAVTPHLLAMINLLHAMFHRVSTDRSGYLAALPGRFANRGPGCSSRCGRLGLTEDLSRNRKQRLSAVRCLAAIGCPGRVASSD